MLIAAALMGAAACGVWLRYSTAARASAGRSGNGSVTPVTDLQTGPQIERASRPRVRTLVAEVVHCGCGGQSKSLSIARRRWPATTH